MTTTTAPPPQVTYGNLRKPRRPGLWGLTTAQTLAVVVAMVVLIALSGTGQLWLSLLWVLTVAVLTVPLLIPSRDDRNLYRRASSRLAWQGANRTRRTRYVAGPAGVVADGSCRLPGLLAASELTSHVDAYGQPFGLLSLARGRGGHHSVVIEAHANGNELVDTATVDSQVAHWGAWLAHLGNETGLVGASVTVETAPDSGARLRRSIRSRIVPGAPQYARDVLADIEATFPAGSAQIQTRITLTFSGAAGDGARGDGARARSAADMATEIGNRLPMLLGGLRATGAGTTVRTCAAQDIVDATRVAYDPAVALDVEEARAGGGTGLTWEQAGPVLAEAGYDTYRHDRAWSKTWQMTAPPRGVFYSTSLKKLLEPHRDIDRKRVTILYRPEDPATAAFNVEQDINTAQFAATQHRRASARADSDLAAARQQATEEARGAGLVRFGMVITATVTDRDKLPLAAKTIRALSAPARLRIREALGNEDVAFAAGLPLGLVLPHHTFLPAALRDAV